MTLASLPRNRAATITAIREDAGPAMAEHSQRLMELGFLPGEPVRVVATGYPSGDPIAVRIGKATFALSSALPPRPLGFLNCVALRRV